VIAFYRYNPPEIILLFFISAHGILSFAAKGSIEGACVKSPFTALRAKLFFEGLCKKVFAACGGEIFFGWRHVFPDFAKQNQEKHVSIQI